ncbi:MAG: penicillin-insensitive murein endopeptidase [Chloroflexi bacterium]|nr:penicillin-insensitive murein endopeptidase [Chloroflexota bacterium]
MLVATLAASATIVAVGLSVPESARPGTGMRTAPGTPPAVDPSPAGDSATASTVGRPADIEKVRPAPAAPAPRRRYERVVWRDSQALGGPTAGALVRGTKLPAEGRNFFTWDTDRRRTPNAIWRRYATDRLVRVILAIAADFARAHPHAPRLAIGDLSRPHGGDFGARYAPRMPHGSHQNGLDIDVYYPRRDRRETVPAAISDIDLRLSQDLVDRFVRAGAQFVFVGPNTSLSGPPGIVQPTPRHDDHLHIRLSPG